MKQNQKDQLNDKKNASADELKENLGVMVYGHLKISDVATGEVLVHKRA